MRRLFVSLLIPIALVAAAVGFLVLLPHASVVAGAFAAHHVAHLGTAGVAGLTLGTVVNMDADYYRALNANVVNKKNVYPRASGSTIGGVSTSMTPYTLGDAGTDPAAPGNAGPPSAADANAQSSGVFGKPLTWWFVLIVVLAIVWWAAKKFGGGAERMSNIGPSIHNGAVITLTAIVGIVLLKLLTARIPIPGLTQLAKAV